MITQVKAKTSIFAYLNFLNWQPSWIKIDRKWPCVGLSFWITFIKAGYFFPKVRYPKMVLYNGLSNLDNITKLDKVVHWLSLFHWIKKNKCLYNPPPTVKERHRHFKNDISLNGRIVQKNQFSRVTDVNILFYG